MNMLKGALVYNDKFTPVDQHIQAPLAAVSKRPMYAGTHFTDPGRMESRMNFTL